MKKKMTGNIYYNPTSDVAEDSVVIATVGIAAAPSLDHTDFVFSAWCPSLSGVRVLRTPFSVNPFYALPSYYRKPRS